MSQATNLVPGDTNGVSDIFVHDRLTGATERVSVATGGADSLMNRNTIVFSVLSLSTPVVTLSSLAALSVVCSLIAYPVTSSLLRARRRSQAASCR
jgi:hypothetical protein